MKIDSIVREGSGRRSVTKSTSGRYVGSRIPTGKPKTIAMDATIRAAALNRTSGASKKGASKSDFQSDTDYKKALNIGVSDVREKVMERRSENSILFIVDASGSMGAQRRMSAVKGAILSLLIDAYQKRDKIGLITFRAKGAQLILPLTSDIATAQERLKKIEIGGKTPLAEGLKKGLETISAEMMKNHLTKPLLILVSDGRGNVSLSGKSPLSESIALASMIKEAKIPALVLDSEEGIVSLGYAKKLAAAMGAKYMKLSELQA